MCYKIEAQKKLEVKLNEKLQDVPNIIKDFLITFKSSRTKNVNWSCIKDMFEFFLKNNIIQKDSISNIDADDLKQILPIDITKYLNSLTNTHQMSSITTQKAIISSFWTYLESRRVCESNIVYKVPKKLYKVEKSNIDTTVKIPTQEELDRFERNVKRIPNKFTSCRNLSIIKLFCGSGIRSEELIGLDMKDVFLEVESPYIMVWGKGKKQVQDKVPLSYEAIDSLTKYFRKRKLFIEEKRKQNKNVDETSVFISNAGKRISKSAIDDFFKRYSNKTITPHMLRHWCGSWLYEDTKNIELVRKVLRHKNVATTVAHYVHVADNDVDSAVKMLRTDRQNFGQCNQLNLEDKILAIFKTKIMPNLLSMLINSEECSEGNFDDKIMNVIQQQFTGLM